ncbi:MAG: shikimate kinase [Clostridia bacterium]|nr:shikimate kinase [Clostridia bacterium]
MKICGFTNFKSGLLGEKLGHSFSPQIHGCLTDYSYTLFEKSPEEAEAFLRSGDYDGINVTIPYKKLAFNICDEVSEVASKIGSVNTVVKHGNKIKGYNTDYYGFTYLVKKAGFDVSKGKTLVLGSGGSSVMACAALRDLGSSEIIVISRTGENNYSNIYDLHCDASFIVNTTPMGMYPKNGVSAVELDRFPSCMGVIDIIFNPAKTKLLLDAERLGIPYINGLPMLVAQAKQASEIFTECIFTDGLKSEAISSTGLSSSEIIDRITSQIESETKNIILIGMPGCGKSTVGEMLAAKISRPFVDIDWEIEKRIQMSICDFFAKHGEPAFRKIESEVLDEFTRKSSLIISTGGGVIKNPNNLPLLKQNGIIVLLNRPVEQLATDGRPISMSCSLEKLANERLPIYNAWKDYSVDCSTPDTTADKIISVINK